MWNYRYGNSGGTLSEYLMLKAFGCLRGKRHCKSIQHCSEWSPFSAVKHCCSDGSGLLWEALIYRAREVTEWLDEGENHVYVLHSHQNSMHLNIYGGFWANMTEFSTAIIKTPNEGISYVQFGCTQCTCGALLDRNRGLFSLSMPTTSCFFFLCPLKPHSNNHIIHLDLN